MSYYPAVHYHTDKMACCTFWTGPEYKRLNIKAKDRKAALSYIKSMYPRAKDISVVFYIPLKKNDDSTDKPLKE